MRNYYNLITIFFCIALFFVGNDFVLAKGDYPRLANYYLSPSGQLDERLKKWDLIILPTDLYDKEFIDDYRTKNQNAKVLAYIYSGHAHNGTKLYLYNTIDKNNWWLRDGDGGRLEIWPHVYAVNLTRNEWREFNINYIQKQLNDFEWDGLMFDIVDSDISHYEKNGKGIDINNDNKKDDKNFVNSEWQSGMSALLGDTRGSIGNKLIVINGNSLSEYQPNINGRMFETFPTPWEGNGSWEASMEQYLERLPNMNREPNYYIINTNTENTGAMDNYRKVRFGLTSTLLGDGYFSFDFGDESHCQLWWYDEYNVNLGQAESAAYNILKNKSTTIEQGLWRRDFENGISLVNSTKEPQVYVFEKEEFEKINGDQDRRMNDGSKVNWIRLEAEDGVILKKINKDIFDDSYDNGSFVRVFNNQGEQAQNGFFAYKDNYPPNTQIMASNIDNENGNEYLVNGNGEISIYKNGSKITSFKPYDSHFNSDISFAVSDLNGDGTKEIITGAGVGGGPHVRVFSKDGKPLIGGFFAYDKNFRGGVDVATGDLDGDGEKEIITGAGPGGSPHVRIFSKDGELKNHFFAYDQDMRTGIKVMADDLDNNDIYEILVSTINY